MADREVNRCNRICSMNDPDKGCLLGGVESCRIGTTRVLRREDVIHRAEHYASSYSREYIVALIKEAVGETTDYWASLVADSKKSIPKNGKLERTIEYPDGHKRYEYSKAEWVPRCMDSSCIGRVTKAFPSEEEAIEAWNRRANDGQHS